MDNKSEHIERKQAILDAAAAVIIRFGYDKATMNDIAEEAGVTRAIVYQHFENKERLFEALLYRETMHYMESWLEAIENDPRGGSIAGVFRSVLYAVNRSTFISAMMKQERRMFGRYLNKPGNLYQTLQSNRIWPDTLQALRAAGAIRQDLDPYVVAYIMQALATGLMSLEEQPDGPLPGIDEILDTVAEMIDRLLSPAGEANLDAGKAILLELASASKAQLEAMKTIQDGPG